MFKLTNCLCKMEPCFQQYVFKKSWFTNPVLWRDTLQNITHNHNEFKFCQVNCLNGCYYQKVSHTLVIVQQNSSTLQC
jgi:hypothetical protein